MKTSCDPIEIVVQSDPAKLELVCTAIREYARKAGASDKCLRHLELAVDEICSNVIIHAYHGEHDKSYRVCAKIEDDRLIIDVIDHGEKFCEECYKTPKLEGCPTTRGIGGLGIHFINKIADKIEYTQLPSGENCFRIYKQYATA